MPRRAIGHGRAVTAPTAARFASRVAGAWDVFKINGSGSHGGRMARLSIATHEIQREDS
jgi:hypothetical protein